MKTFKGCPVPVGMTPEEFDSRIRDVQVTIDKAVRMLYFRLRTRLGPDLMRVERQFWKDHAQDAWAFILSPAGAVVIRQASRSKYPEGYMLLTLYRLMLRTVQRRYRFGRYRSRRKVRYVPADRLVNRTSILYSGLSEVEVRILIDQAPAGWREYLSLKVQGHPEGEVHRILGWKPIVLARVRREVAGWLEEVLGVHAA